MSLHTIQEITFYRCPVKLKKPFVISLGKLEYADNVIVRVFAGENKPDRTIDINFKNNGEIIYPNPSSGIINIKSNTNLNSINNLNIYDAFGRMISHFNIISLPTQLNLSNFTKGIYFIEVVKNNGVSKRHKIILN
jgi:hypothetical protein